MAVLVKAVLIMRIQILTKKIDHDDDDGEEEVDTTRPFQPGASFTPYHDGEQIEMHTMPHEQCGLPFFDESIPLLEGFIHDDEKPELVDKAMDFIKRKFPRVNIPKLGPIRLGNKLGNENTIVQFGERGAENRIFRKDGKGFLKSFTDRSKEALGLSAEEIISEKNTAIREERQRLKEAEKYLKEIERIAVERKQAATEVQNLRDRIEQTQARIDTHEEEQGSNLQSKSELQRLKQLKKNLQTDLENQI